MSKPNSRTIADSTTPASDVDVTGGGGMGPVPEANRPGHRPEVDQDKPTGPPPTPRATRAKRAKASTAPSPEPTIEADATTETFPFRFGGVVGKAAGLVGVRPSSCSVEVTDQAMVARFGRWSVRSPLSNITGSEVTGPYQPHKVIGPPRLSLSDGGLTFATNADGGVCITFDRPVSGALPLGLLRHGNLTVTVTEPAALNALLHTRCRF